jgi:hypothetical protein
VISSLQVLRLIFCIHILFFSYMLLFITTAVRTSNPTKFIHLSTEYKDDRGDYVDKQYSLWISSKNHKL